LSAASRTNLTRRIGVVNIVANGTLRSSYAIVIVVYWVCGVDKTRRTRVYCIVAYFAWVLAVCANAVD